MTQAEIVLGISEILNDQGTKWGLIHGDLPTSGSGDISDLDIFCEVAGPALLEGMWERLVSQGMIPVMLNQYDIGRADAFWVVSEADGSVLQIDVLSDPRGLGRLGIPTREFESLRKEGYAGLPAVQPEWSLTYLVSKRLWKGQWDLLAGISSIQCAPIALQRALCEVFGSPGSVRVMALLGQGSTSADWRKLSRRLRWSRFLRRALRARGGPLELMALRLLRAWSRLHHPVGAWLHLEGAGASQHADRIASGLAEAFPRWTSFRIPVGLTVGQGFRLLSTISRPGLAVTWSTTSVRLPDRIVNTVAAPGASDSWEEIRETILDILSSRVLVAVAPSSSSEGLRST